MKKLLSFTLLSFAAALSFNAGAEITQQELIKSLEAIKKNHNPKYLVYHNDKIVADYQAFAKTNELSYALQMEYHKRLMDAAAALDDMTVYDESLAFIRGCTNAQLKVRYVNDIVGGFSHLYAGEKKWRLAEELYDAEKVILDPVYSTHKLAGFAHNRVRTRDWNGYESRVKELIAIRPVKPADATNRVSLFWKNRCGALGNALSVGIDMDPSKVLAIMDANMAILDDGAVNNVNKALAQYAIDYKDREAFDEIFNKVKAYPLEKRIAHYSDLLAMLYKFDADTAVAAVEAELANKALTPEQRTRYLAVLRNFYTPAIFNYGFSDGGQYGKYRKVIKEQLAIEAANKDNRACSISDQGWFISLIERVIHFEDVAFAEELIDLRFARRQDEGALYYQRARARALKGDTFGAIADLKARLACRGTNTEAETNTTMRVIAFLSGEGINGFNKVAAGKTLTAAERLAALRKTSRILFNYGRYEDCQTIMDEILKNLYSPLTTKIHKATYVLQCPKTADGFVSSKFYNEWDKMETSFYPYGDAFNESSATDEKRHLKSAVKPEIDPLYRTGIRVLYDADAVHIYFRCDDPKIEEVNLGKRNAGELELFFAPGGLDVPYHTIFFSGLPKTDNPHDCEWAMPSKTYKRNCDVFTKDAVLTKEGVVAHLAIPWIYYYKNLPINGKMWNLGCLRSSPAGLYTIGGIVHELSRGMKIAFDFKPGELAAMKKRLSIQAYNNYTAFKNDDRKAARMWNDPLLGDPAFYEKEIAPLLEELDKAGEAMIKAEETKEKINIDEIFEKYLPLWAELQYEISDRRANYLREKLFTE